jgi:hypothetical protein
MKLSYEFKNRLLHILCEDKKNNLNLVINFSENVHKLKDVKKVLYTNGNKNVISKNKVIIYTK